MFVTYVWYFAHRDIKQKNEGNWDFTWDEESSRGCVKLEVSLPKHLDSSLIDVDVHPTYLSIVVKSKVFFIIHI